MSKPKLLSALALAVLVAFLYFTTHKPTEPPEYQYICSELHSGKSAPLIGLALIGQDKKPSDAGQLIRNAVRDRCPEYTQYLESLQNGG